MDRAGPHALVVTGAVGEGDGVYRTDSTFNGKARYVHESNPRQEILWIQLEVMHQRRPEHRTCWHITTDRKHPTDGAWTYESVPESNPERPATRLGAWKVEEWPRGMPTVESKELPAGELFGQSTPRLLTPAVAPAVPSPSNLTAQGGGETPRDGKLAAIGLSVYLEQAGIGDDEQVLQKAHAWVKAQKPTSVGDIVQFNMVDDFVNALDLPIIPKTKLLGALKPQTMFA